MRGRHLEFGERPVNEGMIFCAMAKGESSTHHTGVRRRMVGDHIERVAAEWIFGLVFEVGKATHYQPRDSFEGARAAELHKHAVDVVPVFV